MDTVGRVGTVQIGTRSNDQFDGIELCAGEDGVEYNFGELVPASIQGARCAIGLAAPS